MNVIQPVPSEASTAGEFARQLARILGPAWQPADGTRIAADLLALGGALAGGYATNLASIAEAFADTASQLLAELEAMFGLPVRADLTVAARQTRLLAKVRARFAGTPQDVLTMARTYDGTAAILENTPATVTHELDTPTQAGASRGVFVWALVIALATWNDPAQLAALRALVEQMKPAHTLGVVTITPGFYCDDPNSLVDRNVLGH